MQEGSQILVVSDNLDQVEKALQLKFKNGEVWAEKLMSRKKQVVPNLEKVFNAE